MKNAVIMTITAILLRTIGIFFRIYLSNCIGAQGMGLYQLIFSVYVLAATFASSGISTAVARLITDELVCGTKRSVKRILRRSILLSVFIGVASAVLLFFTAVPIGTYIIKDVRAVPSLKVLGMSLPFMGTSSCLRGYFMARRKTVCPSAAQITEQLSRILFITLLLRYFAGKDVTYTCLAVISGDCAAEIVSFLFLSVGCFVDRRALRALPTAPACTPPHHGVLYRICAIAVPITAGRYLGSVLRTVENILVPQKLTAFSGSAEEGLSQFGMLKGMALPLLFFPSSFLSSLSTLLIPELSEAQTLRQKDKVSRSVTKALQLTLLMSILLGGLFTVYAYDLGEVLYHSRDVGFLLRVLAPLMPVMYLESIVDGMLKGLNQQVSSLRYSVLDSVSRIALILVLVPLRGMGGFLWIMVFSNFLTSGLNLHRLLKVTEVRLRVFEWIIKPLLSVALSAALMRLCGRILPVATLPQLLRMLCGGGGMCLFYALCTYLLGAWDKEQLRALSVRRVRT